MIFEKERKKRKMKSTIQHYGWLVCTVIIIAIMIGIAGPAANFVKANFAGTVTGIGDKMNAAIGGGNSEDSGESDTYSPYGLYQTGALALYKERGIDAIKDMQITSWDELILSGAIVVENGAVSVGTIRPNNLPEKNEYGFYYGVTYSTSSGEQSIGLKFFEDGSVEVFVGGESDMAPAGTCTYDVGIIDALNLVGGALIVSPNGDSMIAEGPLAGLTFILGEPAQLAGDLLIPDDNNVTIIGDEAFKGQEVLTGVEISATVTIIGDYAFDQCQGLTYVLFAKNSQLDFINSTAFNNCTSLETVIFAEGSRLTTIGDVFEYLTNLTYISLPASIQVIDSFAFSNCISLTNVKIPASVTSIGDYAFANCNNLTITFEEGSNLSHIGVQAFEDCTSLTGIEIPNSVTNIGFGAFTGCVNLESMTLPFVGSDRENPTITNFGTIFGTNDYTMQNTCIPDSLKTVVVGGTSIGDHAFAYCESLINVIVSESVTTISTYAFYKCDNLESVTFEDNSQLTVISGFQYCENLKEIILPDNVANIGYSAFSDCRGLTNITIPASVTSIGMSAFVHCSSLSSITFKGTMDQWNMIDKGHSWNSDVPATYVQCSDGQVALN